MRIVLYVYTEFLRIKHALLRFNICRAGVVAPVALLASQLARADTRCIDTGHPALSTHLRGGGWPTGGLIDLLLQQSGVSEMHLLRPALAAVATRRVVLLQPPHPPRVLALAKLGVPPSQLIWLHAGSTSDALWAAEQVLRMGSGGALLFWQNHYVRGAFR